MDKVKRILRGLPSKSENGKVMHYTSAFTVLDDNVEDFVGLKS